METDSCTVTDYETVKLIKSEFPAIAYQIKSDDGIKALFKVVQQLANYTKEQLHEQNEMEVERCYRVAQEILHHGTNIARLAIDNLFIYSVSHLLEASFSVSRDARAEFLKFFEKEYLAQLKTNFP